MIVYIQQEEEKGFYLVIELNKEVDDDKDFELEKLLQ